MDIYYWYPFWITKRWELGRGSQRHRGSTEGHGGKMHIPFPSSVATPQTYCLTESSSSLPRTAIRHTQAWARACLLGLGERISSRQPKHCTDWEGEGSPQRTKVLNKEIKKNFMKYRCLGYNWLSKMLLLYSCIKCLVVAYHLTVIRSALSAHFNFTYNFPLAQISRLFVRNILRVDSHKL